jgi:hypothetical protein
MFSRALLAAFALVAAGPSDALCIYHGMDNAKTTVEREFRDSRWVVRAHIISGDYHWPDEGEAWTLYRLRVVKSFKGKLPREFSFFTTRDSGGFYMDGNDAVPDFDGDYLLFLTPSPFPRALPARARGALWVNYNCGQSKPWREVSRAERKHLDALKR